MTSLFKMRQLKSVSVENLKISRTLSNFFQNLPPKVLQKTLTLSSVTASALLSLRTGLSSRSSPKSSSLRIFHCSRYWWQHFCMSKLQFMSSSVEKLVWTDGTSFSKNVNTFAGILSPRIMFAFETTKVFMLFSLMFSSHKRLTRKNGRYKSTQTGRRLMSSKTFLKIQFHV